MRPTRLCLYVTSTWFGIGIAAAFVPAAHHFWTSSGLLLLAVIVWQWMTIMRLAPLNCERKVSATLPVGVASEVHLELSNPNRRAVQFTVFDHYPSSCQVDSTDMPRTVEILAKQEIALPYRMRPTRRGDQSFGQTDVLINLRFGLIQKRVLGGATDDIKVYPNFAAVARYALMGQSDRIRQTGMQLQRRRGTGLDFHELREYRSGDLLRQVDWKATARRHKLISRAYQEERDQRVIFMLDCGRRMHTKDGDLSHFDHALNAVLLLTWVALRQGDSLGILTFSGHDRWLPPVKGPTGLTTVLKQVYDLHSTTQPSDYVEAANRLMQRQRRRSLVVLVTNVRGEDCDELLPALRMLRKRHLVLVASLRETMVDQAHAEPVASLEQALTHCTAADYLQERQRALADVAADGARVLDTLPAHLPSALVNRYQEIKNAGAL